MIRPPSIRQRRFNARARLLAAAVAACYATTPIWANPSAPVVVSGNAGFAQSGNVLTVTNSNGAIINWNRFSIGAGETTRFIQPSASSSVLNRVVTADPSLIYGTLSSNGRVWLVNPSGIMIGPGGRIDTAAFVASTLDISNQNFLAGRLTFDNTPGAGNVLNQGRIVTPGGGAVYLVGANVGNEGVITTPGGETLLAAGQTVNLIDTATPGVKVEITGSAGNATNLGQIVADAGRIGMAGVIVRNSGLLNASTVVSDGGRVFLRASREAYVDGAGRIVATGRTGGTVAVLGDRVAVMDQAGIDASGTQGGGTVLVGGDYRGGNPNVPNASAAYFGPQATLRADATVQGNGGRVIVWANDTARAFGTVSVRGGANGGNGGFVETSGHGYLDIAGIRVDTGAAHGAAGNWLLDPTDITIVAGNGSATFSSGIFDNGGLASTTIYAGDISSNLNNGSITITTASAYGGAYGDIVMTSGAVIQPGASYGDRTLTLLAERNLSIAYGAAILGNTGTPLNVVLNANYGGNAGGGSVVLAGGIATRGGYAVLRGQGVAIGDGVHTANVGINATTDFIAGSDSTTADSAPGGRIMIDAGTGTFTLTYGAAIGTSNQSTLLDASGQFVANGGPAIGIMAGDVSIDPNAKGIKLNYHGGGIAYGGGGDLGFIPTTASIGLGNFGSASFTLDNAELGNLYMPSAGAANCGTGSAGCRIWIGNRNASDPLVGTLPITSQSIVVDRADFTLNGTHAVPKRVQLSTTGTVNDNGTGAVGGYYGIQAGHIGVYGGAGIGSADGDGLSFVANSASLSAAAANIAATSIGTGELALRRVSTGGNATVNVTGGVVLLPYFAGQQEQIGGNFALTAGGNITLAKSGQAYTLNSSAYGSAATFTETPPSSAAIAAYGSVALTTTGATGAIAIAGDHAAGMGFTLYGGSGGITLTDAGIGAYAGPIDITTSGDLSLIGVASGSLLKTHGALTLSANNLYLTGGNTVNPSGTLRFAGIGNAQEDVSNYGAGALIDSGGNQSIAVGNSIVLQAGSANGSYGGSSFYGASAIIHAGGTQNISAKSFVLRAGNNGHDNTAQIAAHGAQTVTAAYGGVGGIAIYGGGSAGSSNNEAFIRHGDWDGTTASGSGNQIIHLATAGSSIALYGGAGTGNGGWSGNCSPTPCPSSSNGAAIENNIGNAVIGVTGSGSTISLTGGGAAGDYGFNDAGIDNKGGTLTIGAANARPNITLTGGNAGGRIGADGSGNPQPLDNSAHIGSDNGGGAVLIYGGSVALVGGSANYGGAFVGGGSSVTIDTTGNLSLTGGSGGNGSYRWVADSAGIGGENAVAINLNVGGALSLTGGSAYGSMALIGSLRDSATVNIDTYGGIAAVGNAGGVAVGSLTATTGTSVTLNGGSANTNFDATSDLLASTLNVYSKGISLLGNNALPGTVNLTSYGGSANGNIAFRLGSASLGSISTQTDTTSTQTIAFYGGAFSLAAAADMAGDNLGLYASTGSIAFNGGRIFNARDVTLNSATSGIYNNTATTVTAIDTSVYGGAIALRGTEIGLPSSSLPQTGTPITVKPGAGNVSATAASGGINLLQTAGTLATSKYTLASPSGNHVHLRSANAISVDGALSLPNNSLLLVAQGGAMTQTAPITASSLFASAYGGIGLTHTGNSVATFSAYNSGSGNLVFKNGGALTVSNLYGLGYGAKNDANGGTLELTTLAGAMSVQSNVEGSGGIALRAAGNLTQQYGGIVRNNATAGTSDIAVYGANVELRDVRSQRHVYLTASGTLRLVSTSNGSDFVDDQYFTYNLPFGFSFFGTNYTQAYISSNGLITFGSGTGAYSDSVSGLASYRAIAPAWNDWELHVASGKDIFITRPTTNSLAVQWDVDRYYNTGNNAKFEAVLNNTGAIRFNYGPAAASFAGDVTIGISNGSTTTSSQLMSLSGFTLNNLRSTTFTPDGNGGYTETLSATNTALSSTAGAVSGGSTILGNGFSSSSAVTAQGTVNATAASTIQALAGITAAALSSSSYGGATYSAANHIQSFTASNAGSGNVSLTNIASPLTIKGVANPAGNITIDNTGAVVINGAMSAGGTLSVTAHSPITVNSGVSVSAVGNLTLTAVSSSSTSTSDMLNISGSVSSSGGDVALTGGSGIVVGPGASITAPAGSLTATSDHGTVYQDPSAVVRADTLTGIEPGSGVVSAPEPPSEVINIIQNVANTTQQTNQTQTAANIPPPVVQTTGSSGTSLASLGNQTIGGGANQFAGSDSGSSGSTLSGGTGSSSTAFGTSSATGSTSASGTGSSTSGSSTTSGSGSSSSGEDSRPAAASSSKESTKDSAKDSKDSKDKKEDKKAADSSGDKKDDKASGKKPVGKCSA